MTNTQKRFALVIGNGAYADAPLPNPVNDARDMAQALRELGFDVTELVNQQRREMRAAIRALGENLKSGGVGLFYYAGHGMQINGKNYLIPVGADATIEAEVEDEAVDVGLALKHMAEASNRPNIVILDACRNNPFARSFRSASRGLAFMDAPGGMIIAYATAPGMVASDGKGRNGLYTAELLKQIRVPGLKIEDVFKRVRAAVEAKTNRSQVPWESVSITEDFYFVGASGISQTEIAAGKPKQNERPRPGVRDDNASKQISSTLQTNPVDNQGTATRPGRSQPKAKSAESNFFRFDLISCRASGPTIICELTVTNTDNVDKKLMLRPGWDGGGTRAWDKSGNVYNADYPTIANGREMADITIGTSPKVRITFKGAAQGATKLSKIEIVFNSGGTFSVTFRDVCLVDDCGDSSMNSPSEGQQRNYVASNAERTFTIPANQQWFDTGVDVEPGMKLEIKASGTISLGQGRQSGPGGDRTINLGAMIFLPMRSASIGTLIAKIRYPDGKESKKVAVGPQNTLVVEQNERGRLFLGINDYTMTDNQGSFIATVRW